MILPIILANGFTPIFSAILPVIKTTAAAPSFNVLAFAAVIVPRKNTHVDYIRQYQTIY
jgi:hypothetical protein